MSANTETWRVNGVGGSSRAERTLLRAAEERPVLLERKVDVDEVRARKELHDHARSDDGGDTEFHERAAVRGEDDTHPVKGVCRVGGHDTVERDLGADKENEERYGRP